MASNPVTLPRALPAIVCDLSTTRQRLSALMARTHGTEPTADEDRLWDDLEARREALEAEFDAVFFAVNGLAFWLANAARQ